MLNKKNKINLFLQFFLISNSNLNIIFNNFRLLKNEIFLFSNSKLIYKNVFYLNNSYLIDIVSYDNIYLKYINNFNNNVIINKFFLFNHDIFINIISNTYSIYSTNFINSNWLIRECIEFFGLYFYNIKDCRNLLNDYTIKDNFLIKNVPLASFNEIKLGLNNLNYFKKNVVNI